MCKRDCVRPWNRAVAGMVEGEANLERGVSWLLELGGTR